MAEILPISTHQCPSPLPMAKRRRPHLARPTPSAALGRERRPRSWGDGGLSFAQNGDICMMDDGCICIYHIHTYIHIHVCVYVYVYVHVCVCSRMPCRIEEIVDAEYQEVSVNMFSECV